MTDNEMQIAVAEALPSIFGICEESGDIVRWLDEEGIHCDDCDLLNDLNAMHEAWDTLSQQQKLDFHQHLKRIVSRDLTILTFKPCADDLLECYTANATAQQRWEAFLRTLGKFKD